MIPWCGTPLRIMMWLRTNSGHTHTDYRAGYSTELLLIHLTDREVEEDSRLGKGCGSGLCRLQKGFR